MSLIPTRSYIAIIISIFKDASLYFQAPPMKSEHPIPEFIRDVLYYSYSVHNGHK